MDLATPLIIALLVVDVFLTLWVVREIVHSEKCDLDRLTRASVGGLMSGAAAAAVVVLCVDSMSDREYIGVVIGTVFLFGLLGPLFSIHNRRARRLNSYQIVID